MPSRRGLLKAATAIATVPGLLAAGAGVKQPPEAETAEDKPEIHYLNTDLDLLSAEDLTPLGPALEARGLSTLFVGPQEDGLWLARFETAVSYGEPDENIRALVAAAQSLDAPERELWQGCQERYFDIGYDCGDDPWAFHQTIATETLQQMVEVGGRLRITIYPVRPVVPVTGDRS